jgi:mono/diheme cytochrome c family protein
MRTNLTGFALTVGMGLIVILLGFLGLSATGLVGFAADDNTQTEQEQPTGPGGPQAPNANDSTVVLASVKDAKPLTPAEAAAIAAGDALFKNNCAQCHAVNEKVVGPALNGIDKRRPTSWVVSWVHNSAKVIASGDEYAVKIYEENGKQQMPSFPQLSEKDIKDILAWVNSQEVAASAVAYSPAVR